MTISQRSRLLLYNVMAALPIWVNFVHNSQDFSFRGMMAPFLDSLYAMVVVTLAKTAPTNDDDTQKVKITNKSGEPVPVKESIAKPEQKP